MAFKIQLEAGPIRKGLDQGINFFEVRSCNHSYSVIKFNMAQFFSSSENRSKKGKRRSGGFCNQIDKDLQDDSPDTKFGVIQASRNREVQLDLSLSVFQQSNGQFNGQLGRIGALHFVSKGELIKEDIVLRIE